MIFTMFTMLLQRQIKKKNLYAFELANLKLFLNETKKVEYFQ